MIKCIGVENESGILISVRCKWIKPKSLRENEKMQRGEGKTERDPAIIFVIVTLPGVYVLGRILPLFKLHTVF